MKVNSDDHPGNFTKSKRKLYFNHNIVQSEKTDEHGTRTVYDYDQEEISEDKDSMIYKLMVDKFKTDEAVLEIVETNKIEYDERMDRVHETFKPFTKGQPNRS